jgi:hypothetical protein
MHIVFALVVLLKILKSIFTIEKLVVSTPITFDIVTHLQFKEKLQFKCNNNEGSKDKKRNGDKKIFKWRDMLAKK